MRMMRPTRARANLAGAGHPGGGGRRRSCRYFPEAIEASDKRCGYVAKPLCVARRRPGHEPTLIRTSRIARFGAPYLTRRARQLPHAGVRTARRKTLKPFDQRIEAE